MIEMKRLSFEGIENRIGETITVVYDVSGRLITYKQKLVATDSEHLIFQEDKGKSYLSKNRIQNYN